MKLSWGPTGLVAVAAGALLIAFLLFLATSHGAWYDAMKTAERVTFWTAFGVSFGTIALALVTAASVYETQQVVSGEDRRFRQSRVPVVVVQENNAAWWRIAETEATLLLLLENIGDGPAVDVRLTFQGVVRYWLDGEDANGQSATAELVGNEPIDLSAIYLFSYLPVKTPRPLRYKLEFKEPEFHVLAGGIDFRTLEISFRDTFGAPYTIRYEDFKNRPDQFERTLPATVTPA